MLVVDLHTLRAVYLLDLVDQILLGGPDPANLQDLLRVERTLGELFACFNIGVFGEANLGEA